MPHDAHATDAAPPVSDSLSMSPGDSTRQRIIKAALRLFANQGFNAVTFKEITTASAANVAAVHYHFGSKEALIREVLQSVSNPINQMRREWLARVPSGPHDPLAHVVESLLAPPVRLSFDATGDGRLLTRLILQARALPSEFTTATLYQQYDDTAALFVGALMRAEPGLGEQEAYWRYAFAIGALFYIVTEADSTNHRLHRISGGLCDTDDPDAIIRQLTTFVVAGMRAGAPAPAPSSPS